MSTTYNRPKPVNLGNGPVVQKPIVRSPLATPEASGCRQRFLDAANCKPVDRPPIWLMRQAGRALPEYRELKQKYNFVQLVQNPPLATEVTLQPIRRFGFDAAIIFSDILVVAEGLGQGYQFRDEGGIEMDFLLKTGADVDRLDIGALPERLDYVAQALRLTKAHLGDRALLGFAGSPWTLANFMLEGGGVKEYSKAKAMYYIDRSLFDKLLEKLSQAVSNFLHLQIDAGADAVQIFDSLGGVLSEADFEAASARWMKQIVTSLQNRVPVIVFSKGTHGNWKTLVDTGAQILGVDWTVNLAEVRSQLPEKVGVQGNLDPFLLTTTPEKVAHATQRILQEMNGRPGHIFNLGHGVPPTAKIENIESLVNAVRSFK